MAVHLGGYLLPACEREGGSAMWLKKRRERSAEEALEAVQPVESLRRVAEEGGLHVPQLRLSIPLGEEG